MIHMHQHAVEHVRGSQIQLECGRLFLEQIEQFKIKGVTEGEGRIPGRRVQRDDEMSPTKRRREPPMLDLAWRDLDQIRQLAKRGQRLGHLAWRQVQSGGHGIKLRRGCLG